ncbi:hypothetical protein D0D70_25415 [Vibrio parahaemolyticus]|uniref:hypothetical protein n=1 Tax=Vibrio alginolyticus TaxID=663 RepID=UPI00186A58E5|nr:hypothetical protein [Vibrio parahaemolyticus]EGR2353012.1 hypothetical protein [Vibrio alginolyticus]EHH1174122.1 hypothetical protein [Vibrio parahaemolyticus]EIL8373908.1 hypothetical protein [Vibrio alginolyticus]ELA8263378.1 hypothetical protein [Vibrio alginolyticus]
MNKISLLALILSSNVSAAGIPDLTCFQNDVLVSFLDSSKINFRDSHTYKGSDIYKIRSGKLYIDPSDRSEYLYGSIKGDGQRFYSGYMMLNFNSYGNYETATAVVTDNVAIKSMTLRCVK